MVLCRKCRKGEEALAFGFILLGGRSRYIGGMYYVVINQDWKEIGYGTCRAILGLGLKI